MFSDRRPIAPSPPPSPLPLGGDRWTSRLSAWAHLGTVDSRREGKDARPRPGTPSLPNPSPRARRRLQNPLDFFASRVLATSDRFTPRNSTLQIAPGSEISTRGGGRVRKGYRSDPRASQRPFTPCGKPRISESALLRRPRDPDPNLFPCLFARSRSRTIKKADPPIGLRLPRFARLQRLPRAAAITASRFLSR